MVETNAQPSKRWQLRMVQGSTTKSATALAAAARAAGAEIRVNARVRELDIADGRLTAAVLDSGERVDARAVLSAAGTKQTLLDLVDPLHLPREFLRQVRLIRTRGTLAKINFAVSAAPSFRGVGGLDAEDRSAVLSGLVRLGPDLDTLERAFDAAKYGRVPEDPWIELTVPTVLDDEQRKLLEDVDSRLGPSAYVDRSDEGEGFFRRLKSALR